MAESDEKRWAAHFKSQRAVNAERHRIESRRRGNLGAGGYVYFAEAEAVHRIKIGFSKYPVETGRFLSLRTGSPVPLRLLFWFPGDRAEEKWLHSAFADQRSHGEWFRSGGHLDIFIRDVVAAGGDRPAFDRAVENVVGLKRWAAFSEGHFMWDTGSLAKNLIQKALDDAAAA